MGANIKTPVETGHRPAEYGPYDKLRYAVVSQACKDYQHALFVLRRVPEDGKARQTVNECERFFRRDLSLWCDLDGEWIIKQIREMIERC